MRLLHVETLRIISLVCTDDDFKNATVSRKQVVSHAWSEVLKYLATRQIHPKMWLKDYDIGSYLGVVKYYGGIVGCNLDESLLVKYEEVNEAYLELNEIVTTLLDGNVEIEKFIYTLRRGFKFDDNYLFSDCTSLYFKGINIFKYVYGDDWRRLVPIENLDEIYRVVGKTIEKRKEK